MIDTSIDALYQNLDDMGVDVFTCPTAQLKAVACADGYMGINPYNMESAAEERAALIHEEGHFATGTFYEYDSPYTVRAHQENLANRYGFKKYFPPEIIQNAINEGNVEDWQLAEYFGVPTKYIKNLIVYYTDACGVCFCYDEVKSIEDSSGSATPATLAKLEGFATSLYLQDITESQAQNIIRLIEFVKKQRAEKTK